MAAAARGGILGLVGATDRLGASIPALGRTLGTAVERAALAERLGYESVWSIQTPGGRDTAMVMAAYAAATTRLGVGTAVLPIYGRHPTAMAQMAATLDEHSCGRFSLGVGSSHQVTVEAMWGLRLAHPAEAMREYLTILVASLREGRVDFDGRFFSAHVEYTLAARPNLPVLVGALGPRMLELTGELADGVLLWLCTPGYIRTQVIPHVRRGRERAGRGMDGFEVIALVPVSLTSDPEAGRADLRRSLAHYLTLPFYRRMLGASGYAAEVQAGRWSDHLLGQLSGFGTDRAVRDVLRRYRAAGCTLPVAWPIEGYRGAASFEATLEAAAP
jgi:F420-dependent oxidoreductase-like protein